MSRIWTRAFGDIRCGGCGRVLRKGHPVLVIRFAGPFAKVKRAQERCPLCAGEPPPDDLPPLEDKTAITPTVLLPSGPDALPFDFKAAGAGEEPKS